MCLRRPRGRRQRVGPPPDPTNDTYLKHRGTPSDVCSPIIQVVRLNNLLLYVPTTLYRCTKKRSMVRGYLSAQVSWPTPKRRPVARLPLTIHIIRVAGYNVLPYIPTTLRQSIKMRLMVRDYVPAQASWPAPMRRPLTRPSLTVQIIHAAVHMNGVYSSTAVPVH